MNFEEMTEDEIRSIATPIIDNYMDAIESANQLLQSGSSIGRFFAINPVKTAPVQLAAKPSGKII